MSASVRLAKANVTTMPGVGSVRAIPPYGSDQMGDPGLFGSIWSGIKGAVGGFVAGGPVGALAGAGIGILGSLGQRDSVQTAVPRLPPSAFPRTSGGFVDPVLMGGFGAQVPQQVPKPGFIGGMERAVPGGATGMMPGPQGIAPKGYRLNKSGYFLKSGQYIQPGTRYVKIRRRNPLNPKALDRSMSRIVSAKRASKKLSRITVRAPACRK